MKQGLELIFILPSSRLSKTEESKLFSNFLRSIELFTITAEIHARSLANFYRQYADRHVNLKFMRRVSEQERAIRQFVIVKKQIDVSL